MWYVVVINFSILISSRVTFLRPLSNWVSTCPWVGVYWGVLGCTRGTVRVYKGVVDVVCCCN